MSEVTAVNDEALALAKEQERGFVEPPMRNEPIPLMFQNMSVVNMGLRNKITSPLTQEKDEKRGFNSKWKNLLPRKWVNSLWKKQPHAKVTLLSFHMFLCK